MLKNALFFVKSWKNCRSVGGSAPKPLLAFGYWELRPHSTHYSRSIYILLLSTAQIFRHR